VAGATVTTTDDGTYVFALLPLGTYTVTFEAIGFNPRVSIEVFQYVRSTDKFHDLFFHLLTGFDPVLLPIAHRILRDPNPDGNLLLVES
jgi:Carboxypeptidase regulatory-like domain